MDAPSPAATSDAPPRRSARSTFLTASVGVALLAARLFGRDLRGKPSDGAAALAIFARLLDFVQHGRTGTASIRAPAFR